MKCFDLHADIGYDIMQKKAKGIQGNILDKYHVKKFQEGEIAYICMASYFEGHEDWAYMQEMIQATRAQVEACTQTQLVLQPADFHTATPIHVIMSVEGMCGIKDKPREKIRWMYEQGVRLASFCWNEENALATGVRGNPHRGLTDMGKQALDEMVKLGMVVDVSHANETTFWDILRHPKAKIIASHSNVRALCEHPRNLNTKQIAALVKKGGLLGMNTAPQFVHAEKKQQDIAHLVEHMRWLKEYCHTVDNIAFGFDFMDFYEGHSDFTKGAEDCRKTQRILLEMQKYFSEAEIAQIAYRNAIDFFTQALAR